VSGRGDKKIGGFYAALASLPVDLRFRLEYLTMLCVVEEKILDRLDPIRVIAGADPRTGKIIDSDYWSPGAQFRRGILGSKHLVIITLKHALKYILTVYVRCSAASHRGWELGGVYHSDRLDRRERRLSRKSKAGAVR
jgi:hypothetical protein